MVLFMNTTCIYIRVKDSYIYIYKRGGEYIKNFLKKYSNRKVNTYLISPKLMVDQQYWIWKGKTDDERESEPS
jgi:hypothetical protein